MSASKVSCSRWGAIQIYYTYLLVSNLSKYRYKVQFTHTWEERMDSHLWRASLACTVHLPKESTHTIKPNAVATLITIASSKCPLIIDSSVSHITSTLSALLSKDFLKIGQISSKYAENKMCLFFVNTVYKLETKAMTTSSQCNTGRMCVILPIITRENLP